MSVMDKLAHALGRRDDVPNQEVARELAMTRDEAAIREVIAGLKSKDRRVQSDCIKVAYEIGYLAPDLIAPYVDEFLGLLQSSNNRLVWGSMMALAALTELTAPVLYARRQEIIQAIAHESVITIDNGIKTLAILAAGSDAYRVELWPTLLHHLATCRPKDLPQRAEKVMVAVAAGQRQLFYAWFAAEFPDDIGEPMQYLCWTLALWDEAALKWARETCSDPETVAVRERYIEIYHIWVNLGIGHNSDWQLDRGLGVTPFS